MMDPVHPWVDPGEMRRMAEALLLPPAAQTSAPDDAGFGGDFEGYTAEQIRAALTAAVSLRAPAPVVPPPVLVATPPVAPVRMPSMAEMTRPVTLRVEHREQVSQPTHVAPVIVTPQPMMPPTMAPINEVVVTPIAPSAPESVSNFQHMTVTQAVVQPIASPIQMAVAAPVVPAPIEPVAPPAPQYVEPVTAVAPVKVRGPFLERMSRFRDGLHGQFAAKGMFILDKEGAVIFDEANHTKLHFMARSLAMAAKKTSDGPGNVHVKVGSTTMLEVIPVDTVFGRMVLGVLVEQSLTTEHVYRIIQALQVAVAPPKG